MTFFKKAIKRKIVDKYFEKSTNLGTLLTSLTVVNRVVTSHVYILAFSLIDACKVSLNLHHNYGLH